MQDAELFLTVAEIAGVFVGFGALIAVRSTGAGDVFDVAGVVMVVFQGIVVIIVSFAPVVIGRFGVTGHALWVTCSALFLVSYFGGDEILQRISPERRAWLAAFPLRVRGRMELAGAVAWGPMTLALAAILLGLFPDQEPALYFGAVTLALLMALGILLLLVVGQMRPKGVTVE